MWSFFQSFETVLFSSDCLKRDAIRSAISSAISSANYFKILLLIPSGPTAFPTKRDLRTNLISSDVRIIILSADNKVYNCVAGTSK